MAKFIDIDRLYLYIFSFGFLSLNLSIVVGWLATAVELSIGAFLLAQRRLRATSLVTFLMLVGYTLFLGYAQLIGRTDSCHCMGELMPFNPITSILKNCVLIGITLFVWHFGNDDNSHRRSLFCRHILPPIGVIVPCGVIVVGGFRGWWSMDYYDLQYSLTLTLCVAIATLLLTLRCWLRWYVQAVAVLTPVVAIFVLTTYISLFGSHSGEPFNNDIWQRQIAPNGKLAKAQIGQGKKVVSLYSITCDYCRMASQKVSLIQQNNNLPEEMFVNIFPGNDSTDTSPFFENEQMVRYAQYTLAPDTFLYISYGQFPLIMLMDNGEVVQTYGPGDISETEIRNFLIQ